MSEPHANCSASTLSFTEAEIRQQPESWLRELENISLQRHRINAFLTPLLSQQDLNIILTGAGTSAFIGEIIAPWLSHQTGLNFIAIPTTDLVTNPMDYLTSKRPILLVSFSRSGNSPESIAAIKLANQQTKQCHHLIITCHQAGNLYQKAISADNALALLMPAETYDRGFAMTSSITTMMASCLAVFTPETINSTTFACVAKRCQQIIASLGDFTVPVFGDLPFKRIIYLGSGGLQGVARESSLKVLELTAGKLATFYDSPMGFRHGPKSLINCETLVVMFISSHPYTRQYDLDLLAELQRDQQAMHVVAISAKPFPETQAVTPIYLPPAREFADVEQTFCFLIYAQIFALTESIKAGITPDTPAVSGTVNRVVQGVVIHPWKN